MQPYANKMEHLEDMGKFLQKYTLPRLNQDEIEKMNRPITSTEIETVIKKLPTKSSSRWLHRRILSNIERRAHTYPSETISKNCRGSHQFYEATITLVPKPKIPQKKKTTGQFH